MISTFLFQGRGWAKDDRLGLMIAFLAIVFFILRGLFGWYINYLDKKSAKKERLITIQNLHWYFSINKWHSCEINNNEKYENIGFIKEYKQGKICVLKFKNQEKLIVSFLDQKDNVTDKKIKLNPETEAKIRQYIILNKK